MSLDAQAKAKQLYQARRDRTPIPPLTETDPGLGAAEGYAIQQELVRLLLADGDRIAGYKVGATSRAAQQLFGLDQPVYADGAEVPCSAFIQPKLEAEIVFVLRDRLVGPGVTTDDVRAAVAGVGAAVEIVDSRIADWRIKLGDTIADLASNGAVAVSDTLLPLSEIDPRLTGMLLHRNGELIDTGVGAAALGDPVLVVAWLADTLGELGIALEPGHLVMTGSLHAPVPMRPGDVFTAEFDRLGSLTVRVTD
jgi:2-keto-4-pentenoate hydratase